MSTDELSEEDLWRRLVDFIDRHLIAVAFGFLCFLVVAQLVTQVPAVRNHVDALSGRFVSVPTETIPASVKNERADVTLYISPTVARPDVIVYVNGQVVGNFAKPNLSVTVREGDQIAVQSLNSASAIIQVDHNNPNLLQPSPGMVIDVTAPNQMYRLAPAKFVH